MEFIQHGTSDRGDKADMETFEEIGLEVFFDEISIRKDASLEGKFPEAPSVTLDHQPRSTVEKMISYKIGEIVEDWLHLFASCIYKCG